MKLVVLLRKPSQKEVNELINSRPERIIYQHRSYLPAELEHFECHGHELSTGLKQEVENSVFQQVVDFGHRSYSGKKIADWFFSDGHTLWYNVRFIVYNRYRGQQLLQAYVSDAVEKYGDKSSHITVFTENDQTVTIEDHAKIDVRSSPKRVWKPLGSKFKFAIVFALRAFLGLIQFFLLNKKRPYHLIITHPFYRQTIWSDSKRRRILGDPHIEALLEKTKEDKDFLFLSEGHPPRLDDPDKIRIGAKLFFYHFNKSLSIEWFLFVSLFSPKYRREGRVLDDAYQKIEAEVTSQNDLIRAQVWNQVRTVKPLLKFVLLYERAAQGMFNALQVRSISTTNEHGSNNKAILNIAKKRNIPTYGIQHGAVYPAHMEYYFNENDGPYDPFPDFTIVWGERWSQTLIRDCGYEKSQLKVLGQLRTDQISYFRTLPIEKRERPIVLYASQPLFEGEELTRALYAKNFLQASKDFPDLEFVIKPHPAEKDYAQFFDSMASEIGTTDYRTYTGDLYSILSQVQVVVVYYSTVGEEAIYFNKPLLVLDFERKDLAGYIKHKVGLPCHSLLELKDNLTISINSPEKVISGYERYVTRSSFKIDGQAAERYHQFIKGQTLQ